MTDHEQYTELMVTMQRLRKQVREKIGDKLSDTDSILLSQFIRSESALQSHLLGIASKATLNTERSLIALRKLKKQKSQYTGHF